MKACSVIKVVSLALILWATFFSAYSQGAEGQTLVVWVSMEGRIQLEKIEPGTTLQGRLARGVYWRDTEIFPKGSTVRLVVDKVESRKRVQVTDDRPFVIRLFAPRHERVARFRSMNVLMPDGVMVPLRATFIALAQRAELGALTNKNVGKKGSSASGEAGRAPKPNRRNSAPPLVLTLEVEPSGPSFAALAARREGNHAETPAVCPNPCTIADGTRMPLALLEGLSAAKDRQGQSFRAVLLEPVRVGSTIAIPQGSVLEGVLARRVPPRRLYRPGSLNLLFTRVALPDGSAAGIAASPVAAEVDKGTHMTMDSEGRIHAQQPGKARFLLDFGVTGGISKVSDDTTQLIIEAISSTATDASTAGVAKIAAMGATGIFLLTRHGRDVILPRYTEIDVSLSRAVSLDTNSPASASHK